MKLSFYGAARSVTGSRHLLEMPGFRLLFDCGLFQGRREEALQQNRDLGFDPKSLSAVLLSHAHIDHSGALPVLPRQGFAGKVYVTRATADLAGIMLEDSARVQERLSHEVTGPVDADLQHQGQVAHGHAWTIHPHQYVA